MRILAITFTGSLVLSILGAPAFSQERKKAADSDAMNTEAVIQKVVREDPCRAREGKPVKTRNCLQSAGRLEDKQQGDRQRKRVMRLKLMAEQIERDAREDKLLK